jgi:hypothetical protein
MSNLGGWFKDNQPLAIALAGQLIIAVIFIANLEARVSALEGRLERVVDMLTVKK